MLDPSCLTLPARRHRRARAAQVLVQGEAMDSGAGGRASANPVCVANTWVAVWCAEQRRSRALLPSASATGSFSRSSQLLISREQHGPVAEGQSQIGENMHVALPMERWLNGHDRRADPPAAGAGAARACARASSGHAPWHRVDAGAPPVRSAAWPAPACCGDSGPRFLPSPPDHHRRKSHRDRAAHAGGGPGVCIEQVCRSVRRPQRDGTRWLRGGQLRRLFLA